MPASVPYDALVASAQALERVGTSIQFKATWLKQHRSNDPIQQMQTDAILDLCEAVKQIQLAIGLIPTIIIPDVSGVRAAAGSTTVKNTSALTAFKRP